MSDTEVGKEKGYCLLQINSNEKIEPTFHSIPTRPWFRLDIEKCNEKTVEEIETELIDFAQRQSLEGALLSIYFHQIQSLQSIGLSQRKIQEMMEGAVYVQVKRLFHDQSTRAYNLQESNKRTDQLLEEFIQENVETASKQKLLKQKAKYYFHLFESGEYKKR